MVKQKRDAKATKAKIIIKSRLLFSKQGFDATTVDDIARECDVNKALLYYYFKNKSGLYSEVMSGLFDSIYKEVIQESKHSITVVEELEVFIKSYTKYAYKNPYFPALVLRELSDSGAHLPELMFTSMRRVFFLLSDILERGRTQKVFQESIPMVIHFMVIGSINLMVTTQALRKKAVLLDNEIDTCSECSLENVSTYVFETIKKSLIY